ncbi:MAG TPA: benzaldehyde dehydrogenase, partial [Stenotrophomonas sp.]|nr:benzaldehyde dehydrogenase [Stenotrophomonas sp.]
GILPWNFPFFLIARKMAPALVTGNTIVIKPSEETPNNCFEFAKLVAETDLPKGVFNVVCGSGAGVGSALTTSDKIDMISFTGSVGTGQRIMAAAAQNVTKLNLELGGKAPAIVMNDADLDLAVANTAWGVYLHQGQICMATGRVLVHRKIHDTFLQKLVAKANALKVGDPAREDVAIGPLINAGQRDHAARVVEQAVQAGATLEAGGTHRELFFAPTVLGNVAADNPAFSEEIFAPVAVVVPFDNDDEAVRLANDSEYGLSMAIVSSNVGRALKIGERLRTGLLHINDQTVNDEVINPFGGVGASGNGTSIGGPANGEEFTQWQWLTVKGEAPAYPI